MKATPTTRSLQDLANAVLGAQKALLPNPDYQRGGTNWTTAQRQALIDSLLRGYHIPLIYIHVEHRETSLGDKNVYRWIIDGQQRLNAIAAFIRGEFALHEPKPGGPDDVYLGAEPPPWSGKHFKELQPADKSRLLAMQLSTVEISEAAEGEVQDLFIRLQGGTPLTPQEKRDAWPGDFTIFVIRHAGKPGHRESDPSPFFDRLKKQRKKAPVEDEDDFHYIDPLVEARRLFAQIAMTIIRREREGIDFVDGSGRAINAFYVANLKVSEDDPAIQRVLRVLSVGSRLPGFGDLKAMNANLLFHFAMLLDTLLSGQYVQDWQNRYCKKFEVFVAAVQQARLDFRNEGQRSELYDDFAVLLAGSGSDKADKIGQRHAVFANWMRSQLEVNLKEPKRLFDVLEREVVWWRDRRTCMNPKCRRSVPFQEATVHHVTEHTAGGPTKLTNAVLVCTECAPKRKELQSAEDELKRYLSSLADAKKEGG
jgi:hypothetical protein